MKQCSKAIQRRLFAPNFLRHYFVGHGLDIGGKPDPLALYAELFPLMSSVTTWDIDHGDAQLLVGVDDRRYDFVHSSHCLEHLVDPPQALGNWLRIIRPGGHLIVVVPDEDLYEQGVFPSTFNGDHKWTFTIYKPHSWSNKSINLLDVMRNFGASAELLSIEVLTATYRYDLPRYDQTLTPVGECGIEFVLRKRTEEEILSGGPRPTHLAQPSRELRTHLNQYRNDRHALLEANRRTPPFTDDRSI